MNYENFDLSASLKLLVNSPTAHQEYIYRLWNELHFGKESAHVYTNHEILHKNLKYIFPYYNLLASPFDLPDIEKAIGIIQDLFRRKTEVRTYIHADRDADGICSASIIYLFLRDKMGVPDANIKVMLPDVEDKYGLTREIADRIIEDKPDILITLDNGSSNKESFEYIKASIPDIKTIIIDHHSLPKSTGDYPNVDAFINPVILQEKDSRRNMCTSGLAYMFVYAATYSFTEQYNKTILLRKNSQGNDKQPDDFYLKNGVPVKHKTYDKIFYNNNASDADTDLDKLWNAECQKNIRLSRINKFIQTHPEALDFHGKVAIFQNTMMKNVFLKIQDYLPLAAIGTIADSMLLTDDNRILVYEGLSLLNENKTGLITGLKEIVKALDLYKVNISEQDLAFSVCPAVNAAGRMGQARLALDALVSKDPLDCAKNSFLLKEQNEKRKALSSESLKLLENSINSPEDSVVVCYHDQIHRGISGIIASKLAEKYEKPALVLVNDGSYIRGSVRAYKNENVLAIIHELAPWFVQYGGHLQAAGFSLEHDKREKFIDEFIQKAAEVLKMAQGPDEKINIETPIIPIKDYELQPPLWKQLLLFAPYGIGNPRPRLMITPTAEITYKLMGKEKNHARVYFTGLKNASIEAVWFYFGKDLYNLQLSETLRIISEPQISYFRGTEKYQLRIIEVIQ